MPRSNASLSLVLSAPHPAREALASHISALDAARAQAAALEEPMRRLREAQQAESEAQAEFARIAASEAEEMTRWATEAQGPVPEPKTKERRSAAEKLARAQAMGVAARAAHGEIAAKLEEANERVRQLESSLGPLVRETMLEGASPVAAELDAQLLRVRQLLGKLIALQRQLLDQQSPEDLSTYGYVARVPLPNVHSTLRDLALNDLPGIEAAYESWAKLARALRGNASASFSE